MRRKRGFTFVEVLLCVAMIAVLVSLAIPVFSAGLEQGRASTCTANRHSTAARLRAQDVFATLSTSEIAEIMIDIGATADGDKWRGLCPDDGLYQIERKDGALVVSCEKHAASNGLEDIINGSESAAASQIEAMMNTLLSGTSTEEAVRKVGDYLLGKAAGTSINSTGSNFGLPYKKVLEKEFGVTAESFDFRIYKVSTTTYRIYFFQALTMDMVDRDLLSVRGFEYKTGNELGHRVTKSVTAENVPVTTTLVDGTPVPVINSGDRYINWDNAYVFS